MKTSVTAFLAACVAATGSKARPLTAAERADLAAGDIVVEVKAENGPGAAAADIFAAIDIAARPEDVWSVMIDCEKAKLFVTNLTSCEILSVAPDGSSDVREHVVRYSRLWKPTVNVFRSEYDLNAEIRFERVGGDLRILEGVWRLQPLADGEGTRLVYDARLAIGVPLPKIFVRRAARGDVPRILNAVKTAAEGAAEQDA
ncbi:MAG: SRPBCC family protein [Pseudomonadota bacterium]